MDKSDQRLMLRKTIKSIIIVFNHRDTQRFNAVLRGKKYEAVPQSCAEILRRITQRKLYLSLYIYLVFSCAALRQRPQSEISTKLCELKKDILQTQQKKILCALCGKLKSYWVR